MPDQSGFDGSVLDVGATMLGSESQPTAESVGNFA